MSVQFALMVSTLPACVDPSFSGWPRGRNMGWDGASPAVQHSTPVPMVGLRLNRQWCQEEKWVLRLGRLSVGARVAVRGWEGAVGASRALGVWQTG